MPASWGRASQEKITVTAGSLTKNFEITGPDLAKLVQLGGDLIEFDYELAGLKKDKAACESRMRQIEDSIKMAIGDAEGGVLANGTTFTYKLQRRDEYTVKATEFRVLRRSERKS